MSNANLSAICGKLGYLIPLATELILCLLWVFFFLLFVGFISCYPTTGIHSLFHCGSTRTNILFVLSKQSGDLYFFRYYLFLFLSVLIWAINLNDDTTKSSLNLFSRYFFSIFLLLFRYFYTVFVPRCVFSNFSVFIFGFFSLFSLSLFLSFDISPHFGYILNSFGYTLVIHNVPFTCKKSKFFSVHLQARNSVKLIMFIFFWWALPSSILRNNTVKWRVSIL